MKNENKIDTYFDRVKQNPSLISIEKVHQIITSPTAVARLKGKRKNLLKFTMMTTIFAVIISVLLFWPGEKSQNLESKIQNLNTTSQIVASDKFDAIKDKKAKADKNVSFVESVKKTEEKKIDNAVILTVEPIAQTNKIAGIVKSQQEGEKPVKINPDTIQPVDGSKFVLKLSKEELSSIGIRITDNSIIYKNSVKVYCYEYGERNYKGYITKAPDYYRFLTDEKGRKYSEHYEEIRFSRKNWIENVKPVRKKNEKPEVINGSTGDISFYYEIPHDTIMPTQFDFYPVFNSNEYYGDIHGNGTLSVSDFELANDTLVPIVYPSKEGSGMPKKILWFVLTKQLYEILSINQKPLMDELIQYKTVKKRFPQKDIIAYRSPFLIDESKTLKLSQNELQNMGFSFYPDSTIYTGRNSRCQYKVMLSKREYSMQTRNYDDLQIPELNNGCLALFVTDNLGNPLSNSLGLLPILFPKEDEIFKQIPLLIPVQLKVNCFYKSLVFWFLPNENFFKSVSEEKSNDIKAEYNYIIAEDKSTLEKPECKYFEECKNTLKVSSFKVFPNPANNTATVSFILPEVINGRITLVDLAGRERQVLQPQISFSKGSHQIDVDVSTVPEGIYLLTLYSDKGIQTQRFIVTR